MKRLAVFLCAALLTCGMILAGCQNEEQVSEPISTNASQRASVLSQWEETKRSAEVRLSLPQKEYPFGQDVIPISVHWEGTENEISPEDFQLELQKDGKWFVMDPGDYRIVDVYKRQFLERGIFFSNCKTMESGSKSWSTIN